MTRAGPDRPDSADRSDTPRARAPHAAERPFRGNKSSLPSKPCATCGLPMTWRKRWAKNWDEVKYCSDACRKGTPRRG